MLCFLLQLILVYLMQMQNFWVLCTLWSWRTKGSCPTYRPQNSNFRLLSPITFCFPNIQKFWSYIFWSLDYQIQSPSYKFQNAFFTQILGENVIDILSLYIPYFFWFLFYMFSKLMSSLSILLLCHLTE